MDLSKILSVSGKSGLYKIISQTNNNIIAESLDDGKRIPIFTTNPSSTLEDISVYTKEKDIPLKEVFWKIFQTEDGKKTGVNHKAGNKELSDYFENILPDYDKERVYPSDIKKIIKWYNILLEKDLITEPKDEEEEEKEEKKEEKAEEDEKKKKENKEKSVKKTKTSENKKTPKEKPKDNSKNQK